MASTYEVLLLAQTAQLLVPVNAVPVSTTSSGTTTSSTAETFDTVLGYYQASLIAGRRYMAIVNNLLLGGTVAADLYTLRIRNSGTSSNPTTGSTTVAAAQWYVPAAGGSGQETVYLGGSFIAPNNGINTIGFTAQRSAGTGTLTPLAPGGASREMFIMYLGTV